MTRNELKKLWFSMPHDKNKKQVNTILVETKYGHVTITQDGPSGYSSFKSTSKDYAAIYLSSEGNTTDTANQLLMFNAGGANRGGIGYVPNTGEL